MKYIIVCLLLVGCVFTTHYSPNNGTCIKQNGSNYAKLIIKHLKNSYYLTLQFDYYDSRKILYGLGEDNFDKSYNTFVKCPEFKMVSQSALEELKNRKEYGLFLKALGEGVKIENE